MNGQEWTIGGIEMTGENRSTRRKTCLGVTFCTTNSICTGLGSKPGFHGETPATNLLRHGRSESNQSLLKTKAEGSSETS